MVMHHEYVILVYVILPFCEHVISSYTRKYINRVHRQLAEIKSVNSTVRVSNEEFFFETKV